jgi:alpha-amylase
VIGYHPSVKTINEMTSVCLYFKVHQPYQLKTYQREDIARSLCYIDELADRQNINLVADSCYMPANEILLNQILINRNKFKISYSISGTVLELLMKYRPDVIKSFKKLADTGCVEFLTETYYHSLSSLHSAIEFQRQVIKHAAIINRLFGLQPTIFRNTELIHNNKIAQLVNDMGFKGILCEGVERILQGRSANQVYKAPGENGISLLLRNSALSDDIAFRFGDINWSEHPLTADKFADWLSSHPESDAVINLFMDYETIGVHKPAATGIFDFLDALPSTVLKRDRLTFSTPSEIIGHTRAGYDYDVQNTISWEDKSTDNCVSCENVMQNNTLKKIYSIENMVRQSDAEQSMDIWGRLQTADHFYHMSEKQPLKYIHASKTPQETFYHYTNMVADFEISIINQEVKRKKHSPHSLRGTLF